MDTYWVPGVNHLQTHGRWAFAEFTDAYAMQDDFVETIEKQFDEMLNNVAISAASRAGCITNSIE